MRFTYISARGDILPLSENNDFFLTNINGQTTARGSISSSTIGGVDGDTVTNIQAQPRTIILDLHINGNVEESKRRILNVVKLKQNGTLRWTQSGRTVDITGKVESIDMPRWKRGTIMQITMHCEQPFWEDVEAVIAQINEAINLHYFTDYQNDMLYFPESGIPLGEFDTTRSKHFYNSGDIEVGLEFEIIALGTVTNPIVYATDGKFFGVGYGSDKKLVMESGDRIVITTHRGKKSVTMNGVSIFDKIKPNSTWLQLLAGDNQFAINSDDDSLSNMTFNITYKQRYI